MTLVLENPAGSTETLIRFDFDSLAIHIQLARYTHSPETRGNTTGGGAVGILARSTDAQEKEPVDGKPREATPRARKVRADMRFK